VLSFPSLETPGSHWALMTKRSTTVPIISRRFDECRCPKYAATAPTWRAAPAVNKRRECSAICFVVLKKSHLSNDCQRDVKEMCWRAGPAQRRNAETPPAPRDKNAAHTKDGWATHYIEPPSRWH